jgi:hypothetical protein
MLLCADADAASADLASGTLACPSCATGLRAWGCGRERVIRVDGGTRRLRPAIEVQTQGRVCPSWSPLRVKGHRLIT